MTTGSGNPSGNSNSNIPGQNNSNQQNGQGSSSPNLGFSDLPSTPMRGINLSSSAYQFTQNQVPGTGSDVNLSTSQAHGSDANISRNRRRGDISSRGLQSLNIFSDLSQQPATPGNSQTNVPRINNSETNSLVRSEVVFTTEGASQQERATGISNNNVETPQEIRVIWGTMVNVRDVMQNFKEFLLSFNMKSYKEWTKKRQLNSQKKHKTGYESTVSADTEVWQMNLNAMHLLAYPSSRKLYKQLVHYPEEVIPIMDHVLTEMYMSQYPDEQYDIGAFGLKVRPCNFIESKNMRLLDPEDIDKLVTIKGMLIRSSPIIPDMEQGFFKCSQCDWSTVVGLDRGIIQEPTKCGNIDCSASDTMELIHNRCTFADKQICKLQETPDMIPDGQTPHTVSLVLHDEFVDSIKPGDRLEICGIFRGSPVRKNPKHRTIQALYRTYIDVVHIRKTAAILLQPDSLGETGESSSALLSDMQATGIGGPDNEGDVDHNLKAKASAHEEAEFRKLSSDPRLLDILSRSLAPSIFEMDAVKKGLLLQLFGGERKHLKRTGTPRSRGDIHILLIGDPGVSKSQLLSAVHTLAPRGIYTSGKGSSAVGLTAYVTRDPDTRELVLESGALVLSDGGICCIDEFDKMSDSTKSILHEAMEQQTVSITKAGIIASLNARTAILAAANPVDSKWNRDLSIVENINLPHSLISRFDMIFILLDNVDEQQDRELARHIVSLYIDPLLLQENVDNDSGIPTIPTKKLTQYINYARQNIRPIISDDAAQALVTSYVEMRKMGRDSSYSGSSSGPSSNKRVTATARQLESMIRMSEAHAKMRLSNVVEESDVLSAYNLMREALRESATDPRTGLIDLDLLNTGFAASDRRQLDAIKTEVRKMLLGSISSEKSYGSKQAFDGSLGDMTGDPSLQTESSRKAGTQKMLTHQAWFEKINNQSSVPVGSRLFSQVIKELETEGIIQISGSGKNAMIIPRQSMLPNSF
ncbi:hypothetical protein BB559_000817 [Furculomyces boomerangus]|uniref:DNA replication licensing factor MCM4 n=1 Tax=Furculomyces boomerangus TaxID=61424 RepID=A0A2T9Z3Z2_9FUNG|nr:hypothetical protein BB559_000817 [Furculomyces boomerangus]